MTEIDSGVNEGMIERAVSASIESEGSRVKEREIQIVEHQEAGTQAEIDAEIDPRHLEVYADFW